MNISEFFFSYIERLIAKKIAILNLIANVLGVLLLGMTVTAQAAVFLVDCKAGDTVQDAVDSARPGDTIEVMGTCRETVNITKNRITLIGLGGADIDGGRAGQAVLTIDGAKGVKIMDLNLINGQYGMLAKGGASVRVERVKAEDNTLDGFKTFASTARFTDSSSLRNGRNGFLVFDGAKAFFSGSTKSSGNQGDGVNIENNSFGSFRGASTSSAASAASCSVRGNGNTGNGLSVVDGVGEIINCDKNYNENGYNGIRLSDADFEIIGGNVNTRSNGLDTNADGIQVANDSVLNIADSEVRSRWNGGDNLQITGQSEVYRCNDSILFYYGSLNGNLADLHVQCL